MVSAGSFRTGRQQFALNAFQEVRFQGVPARGYAQAVLEGDRPHHVLTVEMGLPKGSPYCRGPNRCIRDPRMHAEVTDHQVVWYQIGENPLSIIAFGVNLPGCS